MFKQGVPDIGLFLEMGTKDVPDDGRYHLVFNGEVVQSFSSQKEAMSHYEELRDKVVEDTGYEPDYEPIPPDELIRRERFEYDAYKVKIEGTASKHASTTKKGGKGKGGVGG